MPNFGPGFNEQEKVENEERFKQGRKYRESRLNQIPSQDRMEAALAQYETHVGPLYRRWRDLPQNHLAPTWEDMVTQSRDHYNTTGSMSGSILSRAGMNSQRFSKELSARLKVQREEKEMQENIVSGREEKKKRYEKKTKRIRKRNRNRIEEENV